MGGMFALSVASAVTSTGDSAENKPVSTRVFRETESPEAFRINSGLNRTCGVRRARIQFISGLRGEGRYRSLYRIFFLWGWIVERKVMR